VKQEERKQCICRVLWCPGKRQHHSNAAQHQCRRYAGYGAGGDFCKQHAKKAEEAKS